MIKKTSDGNIRYAELDTPRAFFCLRPNLADIAASIQPDQKMVNWANKQRAIAEAKGPPVAPYLIHKIAENPRNPPHPHPTHPNPTAERESSRTSWVARAKQGARRTASPQEINTQCFSPYQLRFPPIGGHMESFRDLWRLR